MHLIKFLNVSAGGFGEGLVTSGVIGGKTCQITMDMGSDISLVRPDVLKTRLECPVTPLKDSCLRTVTGTITPLQSRVGLRLQLGNLTTHHTFYLADIADERILSMDYLRPAKAVLGLGKGTMTIGREKIPLMGIRKDAEPVCRRAVVAVTTTLPPKPEAIIPVQIVEQRKTQKSGWGLLHSSDAYPRTYEIGDPV